MSAQIIGPTNLTGRKDSRIPGVMYLILLNVLLHIFEGLFFLKKKTFQCASFV